METLNDKRWNWNDNEYSYDEKDVKEAVRLLKENAIDGHVSIVKINEIFGDKLTSEAKE